MEGHCTGQGTGPSYQEDVLLLLHSGSKECLPGPIVLVNESVPYPAAKTGACRKDRHCRSGNLEKKHQVKRLRDQDSDRQ